MYSQKSFVAAIVTTAVIFSPSVALAQVTPAPFGDRGALEDQSVYSPPEAYVLKADGKVQENGTVQGSVTFWNKSDEILGDMTYVIELLGELPAATSENPIVEDNAPVYDVLPSKDRFVLIGGEQKTIPYTYTPPKNLPAGNYRVEITIANGRGRTLGWYDVPVHFSKDNAPFVELHTGDITVPEYGKETFGAESGPNVTPGKSLNIAAFSSSVTPRSVVPVLDIHAFSTSRTLLRTVRGSKITTAKESTHLAMNIPTSKEPGVYIGMLSLRDSVTNEPVSNVIKYRWVVRGPGADILHVRMKSYGYKKDDTVSFAIDYVGAADAETKTTGTITLELRDKDGSLGSLADPKTELTDSIRTGEANIYLPRDISGDAVLDVKITGTNKFPLVSYTIPFPFTEKQVRTLESDKLVSQALLYGGAAIALVGVITLLTAFFRKRRTSRK